MENFNRIAKEVPAKKETPYGLPESTKRRRSYRKLNKPQFFSMSRPTRKTLIWLLIITAFASIYAVAEARPSLAPQAVSDGLSAIKRLTVAVLPNSEAYQLGFDEGAKFRNLEVASQVLSQHFQDYNKTFGPNTSTEDLLIACQEDGEMDPVQCQERVRALLSPEYKQEIYRKYANDIWPSLGFLNLLENTTSNRSDFVSGFMTALFG